MKRRNISFLQKSLGACLIPTADVLFNLQSNHIVPLVVAAVALSATTIELFESERKAEGRVCAYIVEAQKRLGKS